MAFPYVGDLLSYLFGVHIPLPLPMFGLMVALAVYSAILILRYDTLHRGYKDFNAMDFGMVAALGGILGARIFHILENTGEFMADPWGMIATRGGFSIYGGWVVGTAVGIWYLRRRKLPIAEIADSCALGMMFAYGVGRIGCQLAGDGDWGKVANMAAKPDWLPNWLWAQSYVGNVVGEVLPDPGVYPTPMYESVLAFVCFALMWRFRRHPFQPGWLFGMFLFLTGLCRLPIESIRINPKYNLFGMHFTQAELISAVFIVAGLATMWRLRKRKVYK